MMIMIYSRKKWFIPGKVIAIMNAAFAVTPARSRILFYRQEACCRDQSSSFMHK
jgi:hypothetical protein